jgi:hypothetical protein
MNRELRKNIQELGIKIQNLGNTPDSDARNSLIYERYHIYKYMYICICIYIYMYMYICMYIWIYIHVVV